MFLLPFNQKMLYVSIDNLLVEWKQKHLKAKGEENKCLVCYFSLAVMATLIGH